MSQFDDPAFREMLGAEPSDPPRKDGHTRMRSRASGISVEVPDELIDLTVASVLQVFQSIGNRSGISHDTLNAICITSVFLSKTPRPTKYRDISATVNVLYWHLREEYMETYHTPDGKVSMTWHEYETRPYDFFNPYGPKYVEGVDILRSLLEKGKGSIRKNAFRTHCGYSTTADRIIHDLVDAGQITLTGRGKSRMIHRVTSE